MSPLLLLAGLGTSSVDGGSADMRALDATRMAFKFGCRARVAWIPHGYLSWGRERCISRERAPGLVSRTTLNGWQDSVCAVCVSFKTGSRNP